jgi:hypothetical protein
MNPRNRRMIGQAAPACFDLTRKTTPKLQKGGGLPPFPSKWGQPPLKKAREGLK